MSDDVVVGVDGAGTRTRVAVANLGGRILGVAKRGGASTEFNDTKIARQNLREGVRAALTDAERALDIDSLGCEPHVVTDAEVAHIGAHRNNPGIVAICGTGSLIFGITADDEQVSNTISYITLVPGRTISVNGRSTRYSVARRLQTGSLKTDS